MAELNRNYLNRLRKAAVAQKILGGAIERIPLLALRQGGVAALSKKYREATEADAAGVVFLIVLIRKTTPASLSADASRHFIDCSATPPCGDARRGMRSIPIDSQLHRSPLQGLYQRPQSISCAKPGQRRGYDASR